MTKLIGSTKRTDWDIRWPHELPRDWEKGYIQVEGDGHKYPSVKFIGVCIVSALLWWGIAALFFCVSAK